VFPIFRGSRWLAALLFGLIHVFDFASVLTDPSLPKENLLLALLGFNLGVEVKQLVIVATFCRFPIPCRNPGFTAALFSLVDRHLLH
jgi:hypothetical protein